MVLVDSHKASPTSRYSGYYYVALLIRALTQITPLPIFRLRQVVTSAIVWDGQTVVLGGLLLDETTKTKDKVPFLGDMPFLGRLFRSESTQSKKTSLVIFVTPTIIDPAGNRVHSEEDLPFAQSGTPKQPQSITQ